MDCRIELSLCEEGNDSSDVVLIRYMDLPFFPRVGDNFSINGCSPLEVWSSEWDADSERAVVCLAMDRHNEWAKELSSWRSCGWELWDDLIIPDDEVGQEAIRVWNELVAAEQTVG